MANYNYFFDDKWAEQVYNILKNTTHEQKLRLNNKELYILKNDSSIKRFSTTADIKQQMVMLTKLGYDWFFGLYPAGKQLPDMMKKAYRQHTMKDVRVDVIQEMIESHIFIIDNKAVATSLAMMASNNHSDVFVVNSDFLKIPFQLEQFEKNSASLTRLIRDHNPNNITVEYREGMRGMDVFNEFVGEVFRAQDYIESVLRLSRMDFWILHYLFKHRNNYVSVDYLKRNLGMYFKSKAIASRCHYLWKDRNYIDKLPKTTNTSYTIKAEGIIALGEVLNMIINRATKN